MNGNSKLMVKANKSLIFALVVVVALLLGILAAKYYISPKTDTNSEATKDDFQTIGAGDLDDDGEDYIEEVDETIPEPIE